ncbi:hypothetical protein NA57DRAFT_57820 [Rhizodiscina lignyota]|uniref:Uncharacterized protein n=1 Tax=Rhizodiscina lignyota TaxID=1504668 RepID=A0A9P4M4W0_9PEZI|nr:hypothetical protein NA57DRAFT_57820 [Rhizodiscina lignyota]
MATVRAPTRTHCLRCGRKESDDACPDGRRSFFAEPLGGYTLGTAWDQIGEGSVAPRKGRLGFVAVPGLQLWAASGPESGASLDHLTNGSRAMREQRNQMLAGGSASCGTGPDGADAACGLISSGAPLSGGVVWLSSCAAMQACVRCWCSSAAGLLNGAELPRSSTAGLAMSTVAEGGGKSKSGSARSLSHCGGETRRSERQSGASAGDAWRTAGTRSGEASGVRLARSRLGAPSASVCESGRHASSAALVRLPNAGPQRRCWTLDNRRIGNACAARGARGGLLWSAATAGGEERGRSGGECGRKAVAVVGSTARTPPSQFIKHSKACACGSAEWAFVQLHFSYTVATFCIAMLLPPRPASKFADSQSSARRAVASVSPAVHYLIYCISHSAPWRPTQHVDHASGCLRGGWDEGRQEVRCLIERLPPSSDMAGFCRFL